MGVGEGAPEAGCQLVPRLQDEKKQVQTTKQRMPTVPCACPLLELRALIDLGRAAALVVKRLSEAQQPWIPRPGRQGTLGTYYLVHAPQWERAPAQPLTKAPSPPHVRLHEALQPLIHT